MWGVAVVAEEEIRGELSQSQQELDDRRRTNRQDRGRRNVKEKNLLAKNKSKKEKMRRERK